MYHFHDFPGCIRTEYLPWDSATGFTPEVAYLSFLLATCMSPRAKLRIYISQVCNPEQYRRPSTMFLGSYLSLAAE